MAETGVVRFHGNLDPAAQEFRPARNPNPPFFAAPAQQQPPPPPPPPPPPAQQLYYPPPYEVQVVPFQYHHPHHHPAAPPPPPHVAASVAPPMPPPSPTATRALALCPVPGDASESWVRRELEVFGDVRAVQMERARRDGVVTVHFYDLRHAKRALRAIREQHMQRQCRLRDHYYGVLPSLPPAAAAEDACGAAGSGLVAGPGVWAQFVIPAVHAIPDGQNQGTLVVFNLDPDVSTASLREVFEPFGPVKELRETPFKKHQRFVEFYDVRDAAKALAQMNGKEIHGKNVVIEFSRPGGYNRKFLLDATGPPTPTNPTAFVHNSSFLYTSPAVAYRAKIPKDSPPLPPPPPPLTSPHRLVAAPPGLRILQPNKPAKKLLMGPGEASPTAEKSSEVEASMGRLSLSGGGDAHGSERGEGEYCNTGSVVSARKSGAKKKHGNSIKQQSQPCRSSGSSSGSVRPWKSNKQGRHKLDSRFVISEEDGAVAQASSGDSRTTVMIKNIPNKYSQKLLLNMLDNHCIHCNEQIGEDHCEDDDDRQPLSAYDFVYLPIDFNNKCNVGYGFVNMTTPQAARRLYKAFHLRHWEVFNSRKICEVTYARIQGLEALKEHFKNSKFPSEAEHYLPVVFSPPRDGRRLTEPLPVAGHYHPHHHPQQRHRRHEGDDEEEDEEGTDGGDERRAGTDGNDVCCSEEGGEAEGSGGGGGGGRRGNSSRSSNDGGDSGDDDGDKEKN
ncbi:hypothetical protein ACJRO7_031285 [Eucalyptus globulus]|uniref:RRM domain-containing protein n=1 Tax=Eucalyptus globulus TaxID=34317 RepID=A0ABD3JJR6_EUCGL